MLERITEGHHHLVSLSRRADRIQEVIDLFAHHVEQRRDVLGVLRGLAGRVEHNARLSEPLARDVERLRHHDHVVARERDRISVSARLVEHLVVARHHAVARVRHGREREVLSERP